MFVEKHNTISRLVKPEDLPVVLKAADEMAKMLFKPAGMYKSFYAIAHPQIEKERPLRFFILNAEDASVPAGYKIVAVINPVILKHTNSTVDSEEGCATFNKLPKVTVQRWNKCEVEYSPLQFDKNKQPFIGARVKVNLSGKAAKIFQHEIDHLNAKYIYDI